MRITKILMATLVLSLLSACQTYRFEDKWPDEIPNRQIFIQGYLDKRNLNSASNAELEYHLGWIKKFYQGTIVYPHGWLSASQQFMATFYSNNQLSQLGNQLEDRLTKLGIQIGNEWAQDNDIRLINNACMATWADAMRTAAERNVHSTFLDKVEDDVQALMTKKLDTRSIKYERYFSEESFDDF